MLIADPNPSSNLTKNGQDWRRGKSKWSREKPLSLKLSRFVKAAHLSSTLFVLEGVGIHMEEGVLKEPRLAALLSEASGLVLLAKFNGRRPYFTIWSTQAGVENRRHDTYSYLCATSISRNQMSVVNDS